MGDATATGAQGRLTIDLRALRANWRTLADRARPAQCAAVVKADAYGLGAAAVAPALWREGARTFFVALPSEALALRAILPAEATVYVLNGLLPGDETAMARIGARPVLNSLDQVRAWSSFARALGRRLPAAIQVDSGMARLGLSPAEVDALAADPAPLADFEVALVMSHLACADERRHPANAAQLASFRALASKLPQAPRSLANSAGIFLGAEFAFDLVRPGVALYGGDPSDDPAAHMAPVVTLEARIAQVRDVPAGTAVGYGHSRVATRPTRLVVAGIGYADGWPRRLGEAGGAAAFRGAILPIFGRVSMDGMILDATGMGGRGPRVGDFVELIGPSRPLGEVARAAGTIPYEILVALGRRFERAYLDDMEVAR